MIYAISRFILLVIFKTFFQFKVFGIEHVPTRSSLIVAPNHVSFLDPIIVGIGMPRKLRFMARDSLFRHPVASSVLRSVEALPMKRDGGDVSAFKIAIKSLNEAWALLIFPEGTRSKDGNLQCPKSGIGFLARTTGAKILPCYIKGAECVLPRGALFPRFRPVSLYFGEPLDFSNKESAFEKKILYKEIAEEVMEAIGDLKNNADKDKGC